MRVLVTIFLMFCSVCLCLGADNGNYILEKVDASADLSHSAVLSIHQDRQGIMWFGTYDGLNSYDGKNIKIFRSDSPIATGLTNNVIMTVCQADDNFVWCATDHVLNKFSLETYSTEVHYFGESYTIHSNDSGNTFLVRKDTLYYYNTYAKEFISVASGFTSEGGTSMYRKVYVSSSGDFWYFDEGSGDVRICNVSSFSAPQDQVRVTENLYRFHTKGIVNVFHQNGVMAFIDVDNDLFLYDPDNKSKVYIRNISDLIERYGNIKGISPFYEDVYIGFAVNGLVKLSMHDGYHAYEVDPDMRIYGMFFDNSQGILWIATDGQGAVCYKRENSIASSVMLRQISPNLSRQVRSIITDRNGDLWLGTKGDGLMRVPSYETSQSFRSVQVFHPDGSSNIKEYKRKSMEFQVYALKSSSCHDGFWVGTGSDGLCFYSLEKERLLKIEGNQTYTLRGIHSVEEVGDTLLYVATDNDGLHRLEMDGLSVKSSQRISIVNEGHQVEMFYPMLAQGDSLLWLGSRTDGLVRYNHITGDYDVISMSALVGRSADDVLSLCITDAGLIYVGTTSGLVTLNPSSEEYSANYIGHEDGLLNDMIHGILEDDNGLLWLSTNKGIAKYNPVSGIVHNYYYTSGVEIGEFSDDAYYKSTFNGDIFFGGVNGFLVLKENAIAYGEVQRELVLRDLTYNSKEVKLADCYREDRKGRRKICLHGPRASFSLFYSVPDFLSGRDIEYSYKLEGRDADWSVFSSSNEAVFTSVSSGKYLLMIRYKKDVFDSDYATYSVPVHVLSPWYASIPAIIIYTLLALVFILWNARALRRHNVRRKIAKRKSGTASGAMDKDIMDSLSVIYASCDIIENETQSSISAIDLIKDTLSGMLSRDAGAHALGRVLPSKYVVSNNERISDVSNEVSEVVQNGGSDMRHVEVVIMQSMCYPIYRNAFRRILYMIYNALADSQDGSRVVFERNEKHWMQIQVRARWEDLWVLYDNISQTFSGFIEQTGGTVSCIDKGRLSTMVLSFPPAIISSDSSEEVRKRIVLLTNPSDIAWLISDQLSSSYDVLIEDSPQKAFQLIQEPSVVMLMVDVRLYEDNERSLIGHITQHHVALSRISFLPIFTWDMDRDLCRDLIMYSDAHLMLPYDIFMLQNIVHKAIFGKKQVVNVQVHDLLANLGELNEEDVDFLRKVIEVVEEYISNEDLGSSFLAEMMAMSSSSFYRKFKRITKVTPEMLIKNYRLEKAARLLKDTGSSIADVVYDVGISSRSYFYKEFSKKYGMTPKEYKEQFCSDLT